MSFMWNWFQSGQIERNQQETSQATIKSNKNSSDLDHMEERLDTLLLVNNAMWEILSNHLGYQEKDLLNKMEEIDLRDGVKDGKITVSETIECGDCGHKVKRRRPNCYWCGSSLKGDAPFAG